MDTQLIERKFARLETRVKFTTRRSRFWVNPTEFSLDIARDKDGEHFNFIVGKDAQFDIDAIDVQPKLRHLLLMVRHDPDKDEPGRKDKFLCGFDERHLFVAAVPGNSVSSVKTAIEALKPQLVKKGARPRKA
jgi:hypothetical protein